MSPKDSKTELLQNALCIYDNLGLSVIFFDYLFFFPLKITFFLPLGKGE